MTIGSNTSGHLFDTSFTTDGILYSAANGVITSTSAGNAGEVMTSNGAGVAPTYQPASGGISNYFSAYLSASQNNVTGDDTIYQVICDTVIANNGSVYNNSTGFFTAPATGIYCFMASAGLDNLTNQTYTSTYWQGSIKNMTSFIDGIPASTSIRTVISHVILSMAIGETLGFYVRSGSTVKTVNLSGGNLTSGSVVSFFMGFRIA